MNAKLREFDFSHDDFAFLSRYVHQHTGIVLGDHKFDMVYSRIARRLRQLHMRSFSQYCDLLNSERAEEEIQNLVNVITTNLTHFFREPHHFEHLRDEVVPWTKKMPASKKLRIWSAGCSAGAEAYSAAMIVIDAWPEVKQRDFRILATDIDTKMLEKGREGIYPDDWLERIPAPLQKKYTTGNNQVIDELRQRVAFKPLNLLAPAWPMKGPFQIIFCRNVVIYFDKETQEKLFRRYATLIEPGGFLYLGHSESLRGTHDLFEAVGKTIYRRKP